jgi:hypothetical protein
VRKKLQFEPLRAPSTQSLNGFLGVLRVLGGKKSSPFEFSHKLLAENLDIPTAGSLAFDDHSGVDADGLPIGYNRAHSIHRV